MSVGEVTAGEPIPQSAQRRSRRAELIVLSLMVLLPLITNDTALIERLGGYFLLAVFAISVDLIWGYGGMFTFGHAAFFGGGGYLIGMLTTRSGWFLPVPFWLALAAAVAGAALLALAMSYFVFSGRLALRGVEFAVVTLAVAVIAERLANAGGSVSGGQNGILLNSKLGIPGVISLNKGYGFYVVAALILIVSYVSLQRFIASRSGLILRGIRSNEDRIDLLGYDVARVKRRTFALSGSLAAFAGAIYYTQFGIVAPGSVGVSLSTLVLLWVVLGGRGTLIGPAAGAILLPFLTSSLSRGNLLDIWLVMVGVILVVVILVLPAGIFGWLERDR
jgi:ABC-type branched-subunit amino acid transport system permease subunit